MSSTRAAWKPRSANTRMPGVEQPPHRLAALRAQLAVAGRRGAAALRRRGRTRVRARRPPRRRLVRFAHAPHYGRRGRPTLRRSYRLRHRAGWPLTYADVDRISDEVAVGLAREGVGRGDVVALVLPPGPEYLLAYCAAAKLGAITAGVNDRLVATRTRPRCSRSREPEADDRRDAARRSTPTRCSRDAARRRRRAAAARRRPRPAGRDHLHVGHDRAARRARCTATASSRSSPQTDVGDTWDTGRPVVHRHVVRAPRLHDQAARQPAARRHDLHHGALAGRRRARARSRASR